MNFPCVHCTKPYQLLIQPDTMRLATTRLGSGSFRVVRGVYSYKCAITGDKISPVQQAARIPTLTQCGAPGRQRALAPVRRPHALRRGLPRSRAELQPGREPATAWRVRQRRGFLPACGIERARRCSVPPARSFSSRFPRLASLRGLLARLSCTSQPAPTACCSHLCCQHLSRLPSPRPHSPPMLPPPRARFVATQPEPSREHPIALLNACG